jgi:hypothetical protein
MFESVDAGVSLSYHQLLMREAGYLAKRQLPWHLLNGLVVHSAILQSQHSRALLFHRRTQRQGAGRQAK